MSFFLFFFLQRLILSQDGPQRWAFKKKKKEKKRKKKQI